jgi:hypothetical protein
VTTIALPRDLGVCIPFAGGNQAKAQRFAAKPNDGTNPTPKKVQRSDFNWWTAQPTNPNVGTQTAPGQNDTVSWTDINLILDQAFAGGYQIIAMVGYTPAGGNSAHALDGVITGTTNLQSTAATFTAGMNGGYAYGAGIPFGTKATFVDAHHMTLSKPCTNASGVKFQVSTGQWPGCDSLTVTDKDFPADMRDFANFCWLVAHHCEARHPGVLLCIEIWNEPNQQPFMVTPDRAKFVSMLNAAFDAVTAGTIVGRSGRTAYPSMQIMTGGTGAAPSRGSNFRHDLWSEYIISHTTKFHHIGIHPYPGNADPIGTAGHAYDPSIDVKNISDALFAIGNTTSQIIGTEFGWDISGAGISVNQAASALDGSWTWWNGNGATRDGSIGKYGLGPLCLFSCDDTYPAGQGGDSNSRGGLYSVGTNQGDGTPKLNGSGAATFLNKWLLIAGASAPTDTTKPTTYVALIDGVDVTKPTGNGAAPLIIAYGAGKPTHAELDEMVLLGASGIRFSVAWDDWDHTHVGSITDSTTAIDAIIDYCNTRTLITGVTPCDPSIPGLAVVLQHAAGPTFGGGNPNLGFDGGEMYNETATHDNNGNVLGTTYNVPKLFAEWGADAVAHFKAGNGLGTGGADLKVWMHEKGNEPNHAKWNKGDVPTVGGINYGSGVFSDGYGEAYVKCFAHWSRLSRIADPNAKLCIGGLGGHRDAGDDISAGTFLQQMYDTVLPSGWWGAAVPTGIHGFFDFFASHPYTWPISVTQDLANFVSGLSGGVAFTDGVITGGNQLASSGATFTAALTGKYVYAPGVPAGTVATFVNAHTVSLSQTCQNGTGIVGRITSSTTSTKGTGWADMVYSIMPKLVTGKRSDGTLAGSDANAKIVITELGWPSPIASTTTAQAAAYLKEANALFATYPQHSSMAIFQFQDDLKKGRPYGLVDQNWTTPTADPTHRKPDYWDAFHDAATTPQGAYPIPAFDTDGIQVGVYAFDNVAVASVSILVDGAHYADCVQSVGWWATLNCITDHIAAGIHTITAQAIDTSGNISDAAVTPTSQFNFTDVDAPTSAITAASIQSGDEVSGSAVIVMVESHDINTHGTPDPDPNVQLIVDLTVLDNVPVRCDADQTPDDAGNYWLFFLDTTALNDGTNAYAVISTDASGNMGSTGAIPFVVNNDPGPGTDPPAPTIDSPVAGTTLASIENFTASSHDASGDPILLMELYQIDGFPTSSSGAFTVADSLVGGPDLVGGGGTTDGSEPTNPRLIGAMVWDETAGEYTLAWSTETKPNGGIILAVRGENSHGHGWSPPYSYAINNLPTTGGGGKDPTSPWTLYARDGSTFKRVALIPLVDTGNTPGFAATLNYNDVGAWDVYLPSTSAAQINALLADKAGMLLYYEDDIVLSGDVSYWKRTFNADQDYVYFAGVDDNARLAARVVLQTPSQYPDATTGLFPNFADFRSGVAEDVMRQFVEANCGASAIAERVNLAVAALDHALIGATLTNIGGRMQQLLIFLQRIALQGGGVGFEVVADPTTLTPTFRCYAPRDLSSTVKFSTELGNLGSFELENTRPTSNAIFGGAHGGGITRQFARTASASSIGHWGLIEGYVDHQDIDGGSVSATQTQLAQAQVGDLADAVVPPSLAIEPTPDAVGSGPKFPKDYFLGDKVTAQAPGGGTVFTDIVAGVAITIDANEGASVKAALGTTPADALRAIAAARTLGIAVRDLQRV